MNSKRKSNYLKYIFKKAWCLFSCICQKIKIYSRARNVAFFMSATLSDRLVDYARRIEAIEEYRELYCDHIKVVKVDAIKNMENYNEIKEKIKKEIIDLLNSY